jgi:hypothetical protein
MATKWTLDDLIDSIKRRGAIPQAQMTYQLPDFKAVIDEELLSYALPILHSYREDYYIEEKTVDFDKPDTTIDGAAAWRLPRYAIANSLRDLVAIATPGYRYSVPRLVLDDIPNLITFGWYFWGDYVVFRYDSTRQGPKPQQIVMTYHVRPNLVCLESEAWRVDFFEPDQPFAGSTRIHFKPGGPDLMAIQDTPYFDIISGLSSFGVKARHVLGTPVDSVTMTVESNQLPADMVTRTGETDWFSLFDTTPIPMLPSEMHALLAQRIAVKFLEEQGEKEQLASAVENMVDLEKKVMMLFSPRVEGKPKKLVNRIGLWRRWRW